MPSSGIGSLTSSRAVVGSISWAIRLVSLCGRGGRAAHRRDALVGAGLEEAADDLAHLVERLGAVQDRLVGGDVVVRRAHLDQVQRAQLHTAELLDLAVAREDP